MPRLFVALDLPEAVKNQLEGLCHGVPGVKWVGRDQMHLTLRFIGEVETNQFQAIQAALGSLQAAPFEFQLKGVGQFPPRGTPRVLWVGLVAPEALTQLQSRIEQMLVGLGLPGEDRAFSPHITLGRAKTPPPSLLVNTFINQNRAFETPPLPAREFILYSSQLRPQGPLYQREGVYPLQQLPSS